MKKPGFLKVFILVFPRYIAECLGCVMVINRRVDEQFRGSFSQLSSSLSERQRKASQHTAVAIATDTLTSLQPG